MLTAGIWATGPARSCFHPGGGIVRRPQETNTPRREMGSVFLIHTAQAWRLGREERT